MVRSRWLGIALHVVGFVVVAVLVYVFARHVDWDALGRALRHARPWPLVLATLLFFATLFGKAIAWRILLAPPTPVPIRRLFRYTIAAFAGSVLAPARAGEVLRILALKTRDGVPAADAAGVAVTDKLLHAVTLLLLAAPLPILLPQLPGWVDDSLQVCAGIAAGVFAAVYIGVGRVEAREPQSWFGRFLAGMSAVRDPKRLLGAAGVIILVWGCDMICILTVLDSVGVHVSLAGALFILFTLNLAIALPTTPASIGTLQLGALAATRLLHVPREPALAFALLYQAIQIGPLLVVGFALEYRLMIPAKARGKLVA